MVSFYEVENTAGNSLPSPPTALQNIRKRFIAIVIILAFTVVIFQDIRIYAKIKDTKTVYPKVEYVGSIITPSQTPTPTLTPTKTPIVKKRKVTLPMQSISVSNYLLERVNAYRSSLNLYAVKSDSNICSFAKKRAEQISSNFDHSGFNSFPYPSFSEVLENIAESGDYKRVIDMWISSPTHAQNMRADTPFVCIESFGNYYAYEGWRP